MKNHEQPNRSEQVKMTFRNYYNALGEKKMVAPKKEFIEEMANLCMVSTKTIRGYLSGVYQPDALRRKLISERLSIPEQELFPPAGKATDSR